MNSTVLIVVIVAIVVLVPLHIATTWKNKREKRLYDKRKQKYHSGKKR